MTTPGLGHGSGRTRAPSSTTGLRTRCARTWAFGSLAAGFEMAEPFVYGSGSSRGRRCTSPMGILLSSACVDLRPIKPIARCGASPRPSNFGGGLGSAQADGRGVLCLLAAASRAAAAPNPRRGLVLGWPGSLRPSSLEIGGWW